MRFVIQKEDMLPAQRAWWELPNYMRLLVGGYGGGKTHILGLWSLWMSHVNAGIPGMIVSPSYKLAKRTIIITLKELMDNAGIEYTYNKTEFEFRVHNWDGVIWIGSGDEPKSLRGPNLAWCGIDEPFIQSKDVWDVMMSRVRHPKAKKRGIACTGTPEELNWGYDVAINKDNKYDIGLVVGSTRDNHYLDDQFVESLVQGYTKAMVAAYVDGEFVNLKQGRVYGPFDRAIHVANRPELHNSGLPIICGMDFNVSKMCAAIGYHTHEGVHWFDEIVLNDSNTFEMRDRLLESYPTAIIYPDPAGAARKSSAAKSDHQILKDAGFRVVTHRAHPAVRDRVNAVNAMLMNANDVIRMTIDLCCKEGISDLDRNVWHNGDIDKRDMERTHMGDGIGYAVEHLFPIQTRAVRSVSRW